MGERPAHLGAGYASQFGDRSVVAAYRARPPYPQEVFEALVASIHTEPCRVLELGSGTGDLTLGLGALLGSDSQIDAVEVAPTMVAEARGRADEGAPGASIRWVQSSAEDFGYEGPYDLAVAAESIHWMEWSVVLPALAGCLREGAELALVTARGLVDLPWLAQLRQLTARHSTNRDYAPYDIIDQLSSRGLFRETRRLTTAPVPFEQPLDDYVLSFHSRNGFSRDRMGAAAADGFDRAVRELVAPHAPDGVVRAALRATIVWGVPSAAG